MQGVFTHAWTSIMIVPDIGQNESGRKLLACSLETLN